MEWEGEEEAQTSEKGGKREKQKVKEKDRVDKTRDSKKTVM